MILGILGIFVAILSGGPIFCAMCCIAFAAISWVVSGVGGLLGVIGLVLGFASRSAGNRSGFSTSGIVMSAIAIIFAMIGIAIPIAFPVLVIATDPDAGKQGTARPLDEKPPGDRPGPAPPRRGNDNPAPPRPEPRKNDQPPERKPAPEPKKAPPHRPSGKAKEPESKEAPKPSEDPTLPRKAVYIRLAKIDADVEAAAIKKFGRKLTPDDNLGFAVPYKSFVERETEKALEALSKELGILRYELSAIKREGVEKGWPKK